MYVSNYFNCTPNTRLKPSHRVGLQCTLTSITTAQPTKTVIGVSMYRLRTAWNLPYNFNTFTVLTFYLNCHIPTEKKLSCS